MTRRAPLLTSSSPRLWLALSTLLIWPACIFGADEDPEVKSQAALCTRYCDLARAHCTQREALFSTVDQCQQACLKYPTTGKDGATEGDSVQCRIYHLEVAQGDPVTHCPHGSPSGGGVCADTPPTPCQQYCAQIQETCSAELTQQYPSQADCEATCPVFRDNGALGDRSGNTIQCRLTQIVQPDAARTPLERCQAAGERSSVCVDVVDG